MECASKWFYAAAMKGRVNTCVNKSLFQALESSPVVCLVIHR